MHVCVYTGPHAQIDFDYACLFVSAFIMVYTTHLHVFTCTHTGPHAKIDCIYT